MWLTFKYQGNALDLPLDVQLDLLDQLWNGFEVWGYENVKILELVFVNKQWKVRNQTPYIVGL